MPVVAVFESPTLTREKYEEGVRRLTDGGGLRSASDWPVDGLLAHVAGQGTSGFRIVDVWESEEALTRFAETLMPILAEVGIEAEPEIYPTHTFVRE